MSRRPRERQETKLPAGPRATQDSRASKKPASRSHEDATVESFRRDRKFAAAYLDQVLADGDQQELMLALRRLSEAFGGVPGLAQQAGLNATTLYRTLSGNGWHASTRLKSKSSIKR